MLELFPERTLDNSIHTAIWLGLMVSWVFTERFGWVFAGFVVPGYLAALAVVHPLSLLATCSEAVLTWGGVWVLGVLAARAGMWHVVFGRERFLMFVLVSIPARLLVEGLAAPTLQGWLRPLSDAPAWAGGQFYSVGLVLVPLLANAFWKTGLTAGAAQVAATTTLTYGLLTAVVMPLTNFELSRFELSFEAIALDFLYAPKTYLILLLTAVIAARNNLRYGWDFNGILVPSLLALVVATPTKFVATFAEISVLVVVFQGLLRIPAVSRLNLEGPRRLVTLFTLAYLLKSAMAHAIEPLWAGWVMSDWLGFGYLLTSLAAVKCVQTGRPVTTMMTIGITALQGWALASLVAVLLVLGRPEITAESTPTLQPGGPSGREVLMAAGRVATLPPEVSVADRERVALRAISALAHAPRAPAVALRRWEGRGGVVQPLQDGCTGLWLPRTSVAAPLPLPTVIACDAVGPWAVVAHPATEPGALIAAAWLLGEGALAGVAITGLDPEGSQAIESTLRLRTALGDREVWWMREARQGPSRLSPHRSTLTEVPAPLLALLPDLTLAFDPSPAWGGSGDATLTVAAADLDAALPQTVEGSQASDTEIESAAAWAPLVAGMVRHGPAPRWRWAASMLGGELREDGLWTPLGPVQRGQGLHPTVVVVEDLPGLQTIGAHIAASVDAQVQISLPPPTTSEPQADDLLLLSALRGIGPHARLLWVAAAPPQLAEGPQVWATDGTVRPDGQGTLDTDLAAALSPWGNPAWDEGGQTVAPWDGRRWGLRYWGAVSGGRVMAVHIADRRLIEADGHPDKAALLDWARGRGARLVAGDSLVEVTDSGAESDLREVLRALARDPTNATFDAVGAPVRLTDWGTHLEWSASRGGVRCRATAVLALCGAAP